MDVEAQSQQEEPTYSAQHGRHFKTPASDGLGGKRRMAFMAVSTVLVLGVGALTLSGITHDIGQTPGQVALTMPEQSAPDNGSSEAGQMLNEAVAMQDTLDSNEMFAQDVPQPVDVPEGEIPITLATLEPDSIPEIENKPYELDQGEMDQIQVQPIPEMVPPLAFSNEELNAKIEALIVMTGELQGEIKQMKRQVGVIAKNTKGSPSRAAPASMIALNIIDVNALRVIVEDGKARSVVRVGESLPGGAIFMGFDNNTRLMRTDRGIIQIPS